MGAETCRIGELGRRQEREAVAVMLLYGTELDRYEDVEDEQGEEELRYG